MSQPTLSQAQESTPVLCSSGAAAAELRPSPGLTPLRSEAADLAASSRQRIEWFLEGQAFLRSYDSVPRSPPFPPLPPVSKLSLFLSLTVCRRSSLLTGEGGRGWAWSRIIWPHESLALCKYLNALYSNLLTREEGSGRGAKSLDHKKAWPPINI
jgi:hypothetical protein